MVKRLVEFDVLKGFGMLLVMIGHCNINSSIMSMISIFHMPLFFIVSGFFYQPKQISLFFKKSLMRLFVPYLFFVVVNMLFAFFMNCLSTHDIYKSVNNVLSIINPLDKECYLLYRTIWFLLVLFVVSNLFNLLVYYIKNEFLFGATIMLIFILGWWMQGHFSLPFFLDTSLSVIFYYYAGYLLRQAKLVRTIPNDIASFMFSSLSFLVIMLLAVIFHPNINVKMNIFPLWVPFASIIATVSFFFIIKRMVSESMPSKRIISLMSLCGYYSICLLGFHRVFQDLLYILYNRLSIDNVALQSVIFIMTSVPLILLLSFFIEKKCPRLIGMKSFKKN